MQCIVLGSKNKNKTESTHQLHTNVFCFIQLLAKTISKIEMFLKRDKHKICENTYHYNLQMEINNQQLVKQEF